MRRASVGKLLKPLQGPLDIHKHLGAVHYPKEGVFSTSLQELIYKEQSQTSLTCLGMEVPHPPAAPGAHLLAVRAAAAERV